MLDSSREAVVGRRVDQWKKELIQLDHRNSLVKYTPGRKTTLDVADAEPGALTKLLRGQRVSLGSLFPDEDARRRANTNASQLRKAVTRFREEQGVDVCRFACGLVSVASPRPTSARSPLKLRSPVLLAETAVVPKPSTSGDFTVQIVGDVEVNPVLLLALQREFGVDLDPEVVTDKVLDQAAMSVGIGDQVQVVFSELNALMTGGTLELEPAMLVGAFSYQKLPMVRDLESSGELLVASDVVASLAGHQATADRLYTEGASYAPAPLDKTMPENEYLVLDANSSQHDAIDAALHGGHLVIEGPPGTGKSQTIANIIAGAAATNRTVLFVAEKRAAIEAVTDRLAERGLDGLVLDLHRSAIDKKHVSAQLADSLERLPAEPARDDRETQDELADRRRRLNEYDAALHTRSDPWGWSPYDVRAELLALGPVPETAFRLRGASLRELAGRVREVEDKVAEFVDLGGLRVVRHETPWWNASVFDENLDTVLGELDLLASQTLHSSSRRLRYVVGQVGLPVPTNVTEWEQALALLDRVTRCAQMFDEEVFAERLDLLCYATAPRRERKQYPQQHPLHLRRQWRRRARDLTTGASGTTDTHARLRFALEVASEWQQIAGPNARPVLVAELRELTAEYHELRRQLAAVAATARIHDLERRTLDHLGGTLSELRADREMLVRLPRVNELRHYFAQLGLEPFLGEVARYGMPGDEARRFFRGVWLRSLDDELVVHNRALREFSADRQDRMVADFQRADRAHRESTPARIRRRVAIGARQARDGYPGEARLLTDEASKSRRHKPLRSLVDQAPHVMLALRPCWAMSPLVVSQTLPATRLFDLVVFDEASQVKPHDAITSIMRGRRLVVAGDQHQLPPSIWFDRQFEEADDDDEQSTDLGDYESLLTALRPLTPGSRLRWHYRSEDERLIAFPNEKIYQGDLVTFPGVRRESPLRFELVEPGPVGPGQRMEPEEEVRRVADLVMEHVRLRPAESLGVITLGQKHQDRVEYAITSARQEHPELNEFFDEKAGPTRRFFVKNIETVQGDERDAIILTVGVGRSVTNKVMLTSFGTAFNQEGGAKRLNVAITRAKRRMTVVTSFSASMLPPNERRTGTELLRQFLEVAERGIDPAVVGRHVDHAPNGFEQDILRRLIEAGIGVHPQWGVSEFRIDFALAHPEEPGRMVLAVEADGDTYHRARSARDRDRLRQETLERLGWRFHRIWASAWFADPERETKRIVTAWREAVAATDRGTPELEQLRADTASVDVEPSMLTPAERDRGPRPIMRNSSDIDDFGDEELISLMYWLMRDGRQEDRSERIDQAIQALGFQRRTRKREDRLARAAEIAQHLTDKE